jgi:hypothetical protein
MSATHTALDYGRDIGVLCVGLWQGPGENGGQGRKGGKRRIVSRFGEKRFWLLGGRQEED